MSCGGIVRLCCLFATILKELQWEKCLWSSSIHVCFCEVITHSFWRVYRHIMLCKNQCCCELVQNSEVDKCAANCAGKELKELKEFTHSRKQLLYFVYYLVSQCIVIYTRMIGNSIVTLHSSLITA